MSSSGSKVVFQNSLAPFMEQLCGSGVPSATDTKCSRG